MDWLSQSNAFVNTNREAAGQLLIISSILIDSVSLFAVLTSCLYCGKFRLIIAFIGFLGLRSIVQVCAPIHYFRTCF